MPDIWCRRRSSMEGFEKERKGAGVLEQLRERIYELKMESRDPFFSEYLELLQDRVIKEKHAVDLLSDELDRKYKFYLERMEKQAETSLEAEPERNVTVPENTPYAVVKKKKDGEFTIGIVAFSVVGVFFLLAAFVMLGRYFMNSFAKGIMMYAVPLVLCLFSEALVRRRSLKLSRVLTVLGISGLHVATLVNVDFMLNIHLVVAGVITLLLTLLVMGYDKLRRKKSWQMNGISAAAYYGFVVMCCYYGVVESQSLFAKLITLCVLLVITRLVAGNKVMYPLDSILAALCVLFALAETENVYGYVMMGVLILSALCIRFWHLYYQILITLTAAVFLPASFVAVESEIVLTLIVAIVWLFMLLFNHIRFVRGRNIAAYNYFAMIVVAVCLFFLPLAESQQYRIFYFIFTFLGGGFIYFMFQKKYYLPEKEKGLILSAFLTYMVVAGDFTYPITGSILLLIIGGVSIGCGFAFSDRKIRIYGLVVALLVCVKITLVDFSGGEPLQRMILFFAAGMVALLISGIYILLEKKYMKD